MHTSVGILDGRFCDTAASKNCKDVPTCCVDNANSMQDTLVLLVLLSRVGRSDSVEQSADDGESGTGLDISIHVWIKQRKSLQL